MNVKLLKNRPVRTISKRQYKTVHRYLQGGTLRGETMLNDPLANALSKILNSEKIGKDSCEIKPISSVIKRILTIMKDNHYIGEFQEIKEDLTEDYQNFLNSFGKDKNKQEI